jgi:hypothetical protein
MESKEWRERYIIRLIKAGMQPDFAAETYEAGEPHDETAEPEDAADNELGYGENDDPESGWT